MNEELIILQNIYDILTSWQSVVNLITGCIQVCIVVAIMYVLYRLFNIFF